MRNSCEVCGKPLKNFNSMQIGIGPVCRNKGKVQMDLPFENHADYKIKMRNEKFIFIEDTNQEYFKSVTNDIEFILLNLSEDYELSNKRLFYKDSLGEIDEVIHKNGKFVSFKHGHDGIDMSELIGQEPLLKNKKRIKEIYDDFGR